jgi:hypothetical protein
MSITRQIISSTHATGPHAINTAKNCKVFVGNGFVLDRCFSIQTPTILHIRRNKIDRNINIQNDILVPKKKAQTFYDLSLYNQRALLMLSFTRARISARV